MMWVYAFGILVVVIFLISLILYFTQDHFIFHAVKLDPSHQFEFDRPFEEIELTSEDGVKLNGIHFKNEQAKGIVVYFHNRTGNVQIWGQSVGVFYNAGFDVLLMDYRGFGKSGGRFNEHRMISDVQIWYDWVKDRFPESRIVLYGKGLGAFFTIEAGAKNDPALVILESPMYSLSFSAKDHYPFLPGDLILKYQMNSGIHFSELKGKVLIFHGKADKVIPHTSALELAARRPDNTELILLDGTNNLGVMSNPIYLQKLHKALSELNA